MTEFADTLWRGLHGDEPQTTDELIRSYTLFRRVWPEGDKQIPENVGQAVRDALDELLAADRVEKAGDLWKWRPEPVKQEPQGSLADVFEDWSGPIVDINGNVVQTDVWKRRGGMFESAGELRPLTMNDMRLALFELIDSTPRPAATTPNSACSERRRPNRN